VTALQKNFRLKIRYVIINYYQIKISNSFTILAASKQVPLCAVAGMSEMFHLFETQHFYAILFPIICNLPSSVNLKYL